MKWWTVLGIDALVVVVFATIGRLSHAEGVTPAGVFWTAWPFLVALAGVSVVVIRLHRPTEALLYGAAIWLGTLAFGMWIRANAGDGVQVSFVVVAGIFLALTMLGWRAIAAWIRHRRPVPSS